VAELKVNIKQYLNFMVTPCVKWCRSVLH